MPLREQSRIKANTVAEECTCEECPDNPPAAPAGEPAVRPLSATDERGGLLRCRGCGGYRPAGNTCQCELAAARAKVEQLRGKLAEATARERSMREAAAKVMEDRYGEDCDSARLIRALPLDTGTATDDASGDATGERCNWLGCHCGGLGKKTDFVPMAIEDVSQLLAEVATFHRWGATRMQGLDRLMRRLDWYRRRARAWKAKAKKAQADAIKAAVDKANNRAADAFRAWHQDVTDSTPLGSMSIEEFEAWLRSGEDAPGAVGK